MLKNTMQVKREQGCSETIASDAGVSRGNVSHSSLLDPLDLNPLSPTHNNANLVDIPLSRVYTNLEKALPPSPSTKPQPESENFKDKEYDAFFVKPIQVVHPEGDTVVCPPYFDVDARIENLYKQKEKVFSRITKTQAYQTVIQSQTSDSPVIDNLSQHLDGELPDYQPNSEIASETAPDIVVSKILQQPETQSQMASETCTNMIIHPDFMPDPSLESHSETSTSENVESFNQSASDTDISVSEDQPINVSISNNTLQTVVDNLLNKPSVIELILEPIVNPTIVETLDNMLLSDSDEEDEHVINVGFGIPTSSTIQTNQDLPTPTVSQPINVSPPPTLLL